MRLDEPAELDLGPGGEPAAAPSQASVEAGRTPSASRSIMLSMGGQLATTLASLASTVVLARILTPADFGAFAFAATIFAVVQWLLQVGMGNYILREAELTQAKINGAVAITCAQGALGSVIVLLLAPAAGWFSNYGPVGWVTASVAIVPLLGSAEAISDALWLRHGRYGRTALLQVAKAAVQSLVSIGCQLLFHWGVFALVAGLIANALTSFVAAGASLLLEYRARPVIERELRGTLTTFGGKTFLLTVAQVISLRLPDLLIGRLLSVSVLGHYSRATNTTEMFVRTTSAAVVRATAPRFYASVHEGVPMPDAVIRYCDVLLFFMWPGLAGLAVLSQPVIQLVYGPQWTIAGEALPLLCLVCAIDAARTGGMEVLLVRDRLGLNARLEMVHGVYALLIVIALAPFGLKAVLWGKVADSMLTLILYLLAMRSLGAHSLRRVPWLIGSNALLALAAGGPALLLMQAWGWPHVLTATRFGEAIAGGVAAWGLLLIGMGHPLGRKGLEMMGRRLRPA